MTASAGIGLFFLGIGVTVVVLTILLKIRKYDDDHKQD